MRRLSSYENDLQWRRSFAAEWRAQRQMVYDMSDAPPAVDIPTSIVSFKYGLPHFFKALHDQWARPRRGDRVVVDGGQR